MKFLKIKKISPTLQQVFFSANGKLLGNFVMDVDGEFYFWPEEGESGGWSSYILEEIASKLKKINNE